MKQAASSKISNYENAKWYKGLDFRVLRAFRAGETSGWVQTRREVAAAMGIEASTMSGAVHRLVSKGYLDKCDRPVTCQVTGKSVQALHVTGAGLQCVDRGDFYS